MKISAQPLLIQIPTPCTENWDEMTVAEQGKFCSHCQKTVIDFSMMNDAQVYDYFKSNTSFCGRFRNTQLERIIEEPKPVLKRLFHFYSKAAAIFFTFFSFKNFQASAQTHQPKIENFAQSADEIHPEKITIEGVITDDNKKNVEECKISFDNALVAISDSNGYYSFVIDNLALKNHIISFEKESLIRDAFSFHPLMENRTFDMVLKTYKERGYFIMGGIGPLIDLNFSSKINLHSKLIKDTDLMQMLDEFSIWMKENKKSKMLLNIYFDSEEKVKPYIDRGNEIVNYLVKIKGIKKNLLELRGIIDIEKANTIEVVDAGYE